MRILVADNYEEMSRKAAELVLHRIKQKADMTLGLATGSTPEGLYEILITDASQKNASFQQITTINLDEYVGLTKTDPNSYRFFMNQKLFHHIDIQLQNTFIPNGEAKDLQAECKRYDDIITRSGGIDLQILGIGTNGHIGFNEPGTPFDKTTHVVQLTESTRKANERFFTSLEDVPTHAITMGIKTIMRSKEILLLVSGEQKADPLKRLVEGNITNEFPASVLKLHNNLTILADEAAVAKLDCSILQREVESVSHD